MDMQRVRLVRISLQSTRDFFAHRKMKYMTPSIICPVYLPYFSLHAMSTSKWRAAGTHILLFKSMNPWLRGGSSRSQKIAKSCKKSDLLPKKKLLRSLEKRRIERRTSSMRKTRYTTKPYPLLIGGDVPFPIVILWCQLVHKTRWTRGATRLMIPMAVIIYASYCPCHSWIAV